jgi:uncharacterized protein YuzE
MQVEYDPDNDVAYIRLTEAPVWNYEGSATGVVPFEDGPLIHLDFNEERVLIGVEVTNASKRLPASLIADAPPRHRFE